MKEAWRDEVSGGSLTQTVGSRDVRRLIRKLYKKEIHVYICR